MLHVVIPPLLLATSSFQGAEPPIDPVLARAAFDQARALAAADRGELWGLSLDFPLLFVDPESRVCVADRPGTHGEGGVLSAWRDVWKGQYPADMGIANFTTEWAGRRWTMLMWPLPADEVGRARLLMHESFHNAQFELGISAANGAGPCAHLGTYDGRLWLRLEARALVAALEAKGDDEREQAAADALLFRAMRRSLFPAAAEAEDSLERIEGSAQYTGVRLSSPDEAVQRAATVVLLKGLARRPSLTRSFQYATGPALGLLLDGYDPFWREAFLADSTFSGLLAPAVWFDALEAPELEKKALRRAAHFGYEEIAAEELGLEQERQRKLAAYRARFLAGPVLILPTRSLRRSFDPSRIEQLEGVGSVYGTLWLSDDWGVADAPGGGLILANNTVHLAAPSDIEGPKLAGDGWTLELKQGWKVVPGEREGDHRVVKDGKQ